MSQDIGTLHGSVLVFGGAYSNRSALMAMRQKASELGIPKSNVICTGDIVAYCAQPQETVDEIRDWNIHVVQGNCEDSLAYDKDDCGCGFDADTACDVASKEWFQFARQRVSNSSKQWMEALPKHIYFTLNGVRFCCVHGGFSRQNQFVFASSPKEEKLAQLKAANADVIIGGHCGLPFGQHLADANYWLNAGVIGMPANDGETHTWYMLIEAAENADPDRTLTVSWHPLYYDYAASVEAMREERLCSGYAKSLETGLWPSLDTLPESERTQTNQALCLEALCLEPLCLEPLCLDARCLEPRSLS